MLLRAAPARSAGPPPQPSPKKLEERPARNSRPLKVAKVHPATRPDPAARRCRKGLTTLHPPGRASTAARLRSQPLVPQSTARANFSIPRSTQSLAALPCHRGFLASAAIFSLPLRPRQAPWVRLASEGRADRPASDPQPI